MSCIPPTDHLTASIVSHIDDPRVTGDHVRVVDTPTGTITVVGVVHDHPASRARATLVTTTVEPAVVAVELPPLALGHFIDLAHETGPDAERGGEMTAAIVAAGDARIVGIDGPCVRFLPRLGRAIVSAAPSWSAIADLSRNLLVAYRRAMLCRLTSRDYSCERESTRSRFDGAMTPDLQAADERRQMRRARSLANSLVSPTRVHLRDEARERHMVRELRRHSADGDVVAVVGRDHLEPIVANLERSFADRP